MNEIDVVKVLRKIRMHFEDPGSFNRNHPFVRYVVSDQIDRYTGVVLGMRIRSALSRVTEMGLTTYGATEQVKERWEILRWIDRAIHHIDPSCKLPPLDAAHYPMGKE